MGAAADDKMGGVSWVTHADEGVVVAVCVVVLVVGAGAGAGAGRGVGGVVVAAPAIHSPVESPCAI